MDESRISRILPLQFVKKSPFTGSHIGMRYRIWKQDDELMLCIYPEPFAFDKTPEEQKQYFTFEFSEAGYDAALERANEIYEAEYQNK